MTGCETPSTAFRHGGRLAEAAAAFPGAPTPWIDLSTGINPHAWRGARAPFSALRHLPDPVHLAALEARAAAAFGVEDASRVVAVPGAEAGLRLLPRLLGADSVALAAPTYGGHEEAWKSAGAQVVQVSPDDLFDSRAQALVLVNPNNPDGRAVDAATLSSLADRMTAQGWWLIVDESFVEVAPELSVASKAAGRLIVLRSFGKFYGLPGVRLGFVIADPAVAARLRKALGDWPLTADALVLGQAAYGDEAWRARMPARLERSARRLDGLLRRAKFEIVGGTSLFRLAQAPDAQGRFVHLCQAGILTRPFDYAPSWLRLGLPGARDWTRLEAALEAFA